MAITKDLSNITINLDTLVGTIVDGSTYTSPTRATCGVFVKVYKCDYAGARTGLVTTGNNNGGNDDTQWTFPYPTDGWFQIFYVAVPDIAAGNYVKYDALYDPATDKVYRCRVNSDTVTVTADVTSSTDWELIADPTSLCLNVGTATASLNLNTITSIGIFNTLQYPITKKNFKIKTGEAFVEQITDFKRSEEVRIYELLGLALDGMNLANDRQEYSAGEYVARRAISLCSNCA